MTKLDIFWSFRSPYSYLAIDRLTALVERFGIPHEFRFVRPLAMREPTFFETNRPQWLPYLFRDVPREAAQLGLVFAPPRPDPISMNMMTGKVDAAQPLMERLMALGVAAETASGAGLGFARAVSRRIWGGTENWHQGAHLADAAREAGLDLALLEAFARDRRAEIDAAITRNEGAQMAHHWGVPLMVLDDEPFFGQDRIDSLEWRLQQSAAR